MLGVGTAHFRLQTVEVKAHFPLRRRRDINGDGNADLVVSNDCPIAQDCSASSVIALLGSGDGNFRSPPPASPHTAGAPLAATAADFKWATR
jgi:hypothetical protein